MGLLAFWMFIHLALASTSTCQAQSTNAVTNAHIRMNVDRLNRITDGLQKDVSYILTAMTSSGIQRLEYGYRTRTDTNDFGKQGEGITAKFDETVNDAKQLKSEVQGLILHSRNGFKNEKKFQREVIREIKERYEAFQTDQTERNREMNYDIERLLTKSAEMNNRLDGSINVTEDHDSRLESMDTMMENLSVKQSRPQSENQELKQKLSVMLEELNRFRASAGLSTCGEGWIRFHGSCYQFVDSYKTWTEAVATCASLGGYLVEVTTQSELQFVLDLRTRKGNAVLVGASDEIQGYEGRFVYQHSKRALPNTFWLDGEPNNHLGVEHCVEIYGKSDIAMLNDIGCMHKLKFVCEKSATPVGQ